MSRTGEAPRQPLLRVSHVWCDEVMADAVLGEPAPVTLGSDGSTSFTIPDLGLPDGFAILRPGARGYVLTLGAGMGGRMRLGGEELEVSRFVAGGGGERAEGAAGAFRATPVGPGDWGVIELDRTGDHTLFFQFVAEEAPLPRRHLANWGLLLAALAFSSVLHTALLIMTYVLDDEGNSLVFPGNRALLTDYILRPPAPPPDEVGADAAVAGDEKEVDVEPAASRGAEGKMGGEGKERSAGPKPPGPEVDEDIEVAFLDRSNRDRLRRIGGGDSDMPDVLDRVNRRLAAMPSMGDRGAGRGRGGGVGDFDGTGTGTRGGGSGGGGKNDRDVIGKGKALDAGGNRAGPGGPGSGKGGKGLSERAVTKLGQPSGKFDGLTAEEIARVMQSASGGFRACYQAQLNRNPNLGGTVVVNFRIAPDGKVSKARVVPGKSSLRNDPVESCITRKLLRLRFPAKGGGVVNYPLIFSAG